MTATSSRNGVAPETGRAVGLRVGGMDKGLLEVMLGLVEGAVTRQAGLELLGNVVELELGLDGGDGIVERLRLFVERQLLALQHRHPGAQRRHLAREVLAAKTPQLGITGNRRGCRHAGDFFLESFGLLLNGRQRQLLGFGRLAPFRRTVESVHVIGVVLTNRQHQLDVALGHATHRVNCGLGAEHHGHSGKGQQQQRLISHSAFRSLGSDSRGTHD